MCEFYNSKAMLAFTSSFLPFRSCRDLDRNRSRRHLVPVLCVPACSLSASSPSPRGLSRRSLLSGATWAAISLALGPAVAVEESLTTPSGLQIKVLNKGGGARVKVGDLVAIRFSGSYNGATFDDIFGTPEPYFYRCGSDVVLKVRESLSLFEHPFHMG